MNRQDDWVEQLIDATLARSQEAARAAEPDAGFEARMLQRLQPDGQPGGIPRWPIWFGAGCTAAVAALLIWIAIPTLPGPPPMPAPVRFNAQIASPHEPMQIAQTRPVALPHRASGARHHSFSAVFPTPQPPTEQERLLLQFVSSVSPAEVIRTAQEIEFPIGPSDPNDISSPSGSLR